jgi:pseudouridine-5'-phosphate glycosidase
MLDIRPDIAEAIAAGRPVIALESTLIAHGLPTPANLQTALAAESAVRCAGGMPATIAVLRGRPTIGLNAEEVSYLASSNSIFKASRRDLASTLTLGQTAATTVSATMFLAHQAGIRLMATGGIGGVHRNQSGDISSDLTELARTPVAVVCSGAKSILDLAHTVELLETLGVPVIGMRTDEFPGFYWTSTGLPVSVRVDNPAEAAGLLHGHWRNGGAGILIAQPLGAEHALPREQMERAIDEAMIQAEAQHIHGPALTPFLLATLQRSFSELVAANREMVVRNAQLAAEIASSYQKR